MDHDEMAVRFLGWVEANRDALRGSGGRGPSPGTFTAFAHLIEGEWARGEGLSLTRTDAEAIAFHAVVMADSRHR